jgi:hypothetical protein
VVTHIRRRSELACSGKEPVAEHRQAAHGLRPGCIVLKDILVRVNAVTGETRVSRFVGSFGCGRILNVKTASSWAWGSPERTQKIRYPKIIGGRMTAARRSSVTRFAKWQFRSKTHPY